MADDLGDTRIDVFLGGVTDEQIDEIIEDICNVLAKRGLACEDEESTVRSLVAASGIPFPDFDDDESVKMFLSDYGRIALPKADGEQKIGKVDTDDDVSRL